MATNNLPEGSLPPEALPERELATLDIVLVHEPTDPRLDRFLAQQGLAIRIIDAPPDSTSGRYDFRRIMGAPLDLAVTDSLLFQTYRYGDVLTRGAARLETTARSTAGTLAVPFTQMAYAAEARGDATRMIRYLEPAAQLSTNPAIRQALTEVRESLPAKRP
jgi:hypothetical protein